MRDMASCDTGRAGKQSHKSGSCGDVEFLVECFLDDVE